MRIDFIHLQNYRPYLNEKIIFGSDEENKNFTIIQGANGAGKSSLLNAITWCLYDEEIHIKNDLKGLPVFNTEAFENLKKKETIETKVEIQMIDKQGTKHSFSRSIKYIKNSNGREDLMADPSSKEKDGSTFQYFIEESNQWKLVTDPKFHLEQIMPEAIKEYFFFDGERLNKFFSESKSEAIKQAVFDISQISAIEKAIKRLKDKRRDFLDDAGDLGPDIQKLRDEINLRQKSLDDFKERLRETKWHRDQAKKLEEGVSEDLKQYPDSANFETERIKVQENLKKVEDDLKYFKGEKLKKLLKSSTPVIAYEAITFTKELVEKEVSEDKYPPDAKKGFLEGLLKNGKCICGESLSDPECRRNVEELLERVATASEICSEVMNMQGKLTSLLDQVKDFDEEQVDLSKKIRELEKDEESLNKQHEVLLKKIGSSPLEKIKLLKETLEGARAEWERNVKEIGMMETKISLEEKNIAMKDQELTKKIKEQSKFEYVTLVLGFLEASIRQAEQIKNEIMHEVREKIQEKTKQQFLSLIWNPQAFKDVIIDEEYNISVIHLSDREGIGTLSAGQRQVLALSFMAALKQVSGFDIPIVIDTPLGRISKEPKNNIAKKLPNYLKGSQVTMLVTEEEYTPEVRDLLRERVGREYQIILENPSSAKVIKYGK
jgi:DNA sulfur modification protein DndD